MLEKAYKEKIQKELKKLYNLGGSELIDIQEDFVNDIMGIFDEQYKTALEGIRNNVEVQMNDWIAESESIKKIYSEDQLKKYNKHFTNSFKVGAQKLDLSVSKEPGVNTKIGIKDKDAEDYAKENAGKQITKIDDYTRKRINKLVNFGIEEGWGYNRISKALQKDYSFSRYRANLIASHEVGEAYLNGKDTQFNRYRDEYGVDGWKSWISHRDDVTTEGCQHNDYQGWIPYSDDFEASGNNEKPTRFIGCRCNILYKLFNPDEDRVTTDNVEENMFEQSRVPEDNGFNEGVKPENYNNHTTSSVGTKTFNYIGKPSKYTGKGEAYFKTGKVSIINIGKKTTPVISRKFSEAHEVGHFLFEEKIFKNKDHLDEFLKVFRIGAKEIEDSLENLTFFQAVETNFVNESAEIIKKEVQAIKNISSYKLTKEVKKIKGAGGTTTVTDLVPSVKFKEEVEAFLDTVGSLTKQRVYGAGHSYQYYTTSQANELIEGRDLTVGDSISKKQAHEFFAHLNENYFLGNKVMQAMMPKTYKAMVEYYASIGIKLK